MERAHAEGATLAALPENFAIMGRKERDKVEAAEMPGEGPIQAFLGHCARELGMWIIGGTIPLRVDSETQRVASASLVFDERGRCVARYDKIHLFDVAIPNQEEPNKEERYRESATVAPGSQASGRAHADRPRRHGGLLRRALSRAVPGAAGAGGGNP